MRGISTCCPEPVSTINITQNVVEMDGTRAFWVEQHFLGSEYVVASGFALTYVPYARSQLSLLLNTGAMRQGPDFTVTATKVYLTFVPQPDDKIVIRYFALTDGTSSVLADSTLTTGMTMGFGGTVIPDGWADMNGSTPLSRAEGSSSGKLYEWCTTYAPTYIKEENEEANTFTLISNKSTFYNGTTLVTGKTLIKL